MQKFLFLLSFLVMVCVSAIAQTKTVTGTVIGEDGLPIPGAAVMVKGTTSGTVTDMDGKYRLSVPEGSDILLFRFVGMADQEQLINGRTVVDATMQSDWEELDEVMVVAYGTQKKSAFTGSATQIKSDDIENHIASNVTSVLAGTTPGVISTSSNGDPTNNAPTIRIRGVGSMSASNNPLYIVDGMPYDGPINAINSQDVASMTVLKDAAASAIYGARGANGVILITTKKGRDQGAEIKVDAKWGSNSRLIPQYDVIDNPGQYYETYYKQLYNSQYYNGKSADYSYQYADEHLIDYNSGGLGYQVFTVPEGEKLIGSNFKLNPNATLGYTENGYYYTPDDWYDETFHNSFRQEYNLSASGVTDRLNYYMSVGFLQDGGIVDNSELKRYTGRLNVDYQVKDWIKFGTNMSFTHQDSDKPSYTTTSWASSGNLFYICNNMGPIYPLYVRNADGSIMHDENGLIVYDSGQTGYKNPSVVGNAVRDNAVNKKKAYRDIFSGKWSAVITPIEGLSFSVNLGANIDNTRANYLYSQFGSYSSVDGVVEVIHEREIGITSQYLANYNKTFAEVHNFDFLVGYEQYKEKYQLLDADNDHLYNPTIGELSNTNGADSKEMDSYTLNYMTEGFIGRLQYDYNNTYFLSGSYRRDASSHFADGHRWGNFGSVGLAWMITNEEFMNVDQLDELKLKVSYGIQGNDNFGTEKEDYYPYADQYDTSWNKETGEYSVTMTHKGNDELTWETSRSFNVGVDFSLFKHRLNGSVEWFMRKTTDLLYNKPTPLSSGNTTGSIPTNIGSVLNTGIEISLDGVVYKNENIEWSLNANISHYTNEIKELDETVAETGIKGGYYIYRIGGSLYQAYLYKYAGVNPENGKALFYMENTDGSITTTENFSNATQFDCGTTLPKVYGGFGTTVRAFGFDLTAQCSFQLGGKMYDGTYQSMMHTNSGNQGMAWHKDALKAWTPENTNTNIPRLDGDTSVGQSAVDCFQIKSDYLSLNNVTLGYNVPKKLLERIKLGSMRFYVSGENLAVLTKRKGIDPRYNLGIGSFTSGTGLASGSYSSVRTITGGLTFTF